MSLPKNGTKLNPSGTNQPWIARLQKRGLSLATIRWAGVRPSGDGWIYPFAPDDRRNLRWKAFDSSATPKYMWYSDGRPGSKPAHARLYDPHGDLIAHVADAGGVLHLPEGEAVSTWALQEGAIFNVSATMAGAGSVPAWLPDELARLGVKHLIAYPDNDQAGRDWAAKLRAALAGTGIVLDVRDVSAVVSAPKADVADILLAVGPDRLESTLLSLPALALPDAPAPTPARRTISTISLKRSPDSESLREAWALEVERAAVATWNIAPPNGRGFSRKPFRCPDGHHHNANDRNASASYNYQTHGYHCFVGGYVNTDQMAAQLGHEPYEDYKQRHAPRRRKVAKGQPASLEGTITPIRLADLRAHETISTRYVSDLAASDVLQHRAVAIKSPLNTGKTELVKRLIAHLEQGAHTANILVITHRQALAADIAQRLGLEVYSSIPAHMLQYANRLVITLNSLHKIGTDHAWDLVVIDELEQFAQHPYGGTFRGKEAYEASIALAAALRSTQHIIGLDAHLTDVGIAFLRAFAKTDPHVIVNTYRHAWGKLTIHARPESVLKDAEKALEKGGGPIVITTNSRAKSKLYYRHVCDLLGSSDGVMLVNGENSVNAEAQRFIERINEELPNLRALICTSSFGTGLDVTAPVYGVYGVMFNQPLIATDMIQMIGRFRNAQHRHVFVQHLHLADAASADERLADQIAAAQATAAAADFSQHRVETFAPGHKLLEGLRAQIQAAADIQRTDLLSYFVAYATAEGFELAYSDRKAVRVREALLATAERMAEEWRAAVLAATAISRDEYRQHQQAGTVTPEVVAGYERWKIENTVGLEITGELYDDLHTSQKRAAVRNLTDLLTEPARLQERDRAEASEKYLLSKRGHYTTRRQLAVEALGLVFGREGIRTDDRLTEAHIVERLGAWVETNLPAVQRLIDNRTDLSRDPMFVLRRLLKALGLKLERQRLRVEGERTWYYFLDSAAREKALEYVRARLAHLARLEALSTNTEGGDLYALVDTPPEPALEPAIYWPDWSAARPVEPAGAAAGAGKGRDGA